MFLARRGLYVDQLASVVVNVHPFSAMTHPLPLSENTSLPSLRVASLLSLHGRRALITGASSGIGAHLAAVLHEAGADVVLCARRADRLRDLAAVLNRRCESDSDASGSGRKLGG